MLRRVFLTAIPGAALLSIVACSNEIAKTGAVSATGESTPEVVVDIGNRLFPPVADSGASNRTTASRTKLVDPIVIDDCRLAVYEKQEAPAQKDGVIEFIGTVVTDEELPKVPKDRLRTITVGKGDSKQTVHYRELREGDMVEEGQLLARLDDRLARDECDIKQAKISVAVADKDAAEKTKGEAENRYRTQERLYQTGSGTGRATSAEDYRAAKLVWDTKAAESISKSEAHKQSLLEHNQAMTNLELHEIRARIPGMIKTIHKKKGESVRNLEPVVQILNLKKLRAEGLMDRQHLYRLGDSKKQREAKVFLEVAPTEAPRRILKGHRQEVTSVAVGRGRDGKCFIVSTSEDHTLRVWSPEAEKEQLVVKLPHGATPKCVACSPLGGRTSLVMCGASDGIVRVWDVNERPAGATGSPEPKFKLEPHSGAVTSVAISPDGVYGASGGEDRQICIWDLNNGKLLYSIPDAHTGIITTLQFTPKAQLLSAGRDNYIRVWELGDKAARLEMNQPNRSGDVAQIGASPDGKSILFDHGREIQVLSVPGGLNEGYLHRPPKGGGFTGFALFSPDGELILTSGGSENVIQLWRAPTGGDRRGYEVRQMVLNPRSQATCAAFAPDGTFVITGHKNKDICVWKTPTADELGEVVPAQLVLADQTAESSAGQVRVWANVLKEGLIPNTMGTLVIEPGQ